MTSSNLLNLLRGATFVFVCRVTGAILAFVSQIVLARWMGVEQTGVYIFAFSVCVLLTTAAGLGFPAAAVRFIGAALADDRSDRVLGFARRSLQLPLLMGVGVALLAGLLVVSVDGLVPGDRRYPLLLAFLTVPLFAVLNSRASVALGLTWFRTAFFPSSVLRPLLFLSLIGGVWSATGSLSASKAMALQLLAIALVLGLQLFIVARGLARKFPDTVPGYETSVWTRTAAPLLVVTLFTNYFLELNVFIAGTLLDDAQLAIFNASFRVAALIAFGLFAVDGITMPVVSRLYASGAKAELQTIVTRAARLRLVGALVAIVPLVIFGETILGLFGEPFIAGYEMLLILSAAQVVNAAFGPAARVLSVTGHQNQCLRIFALSLVGMLALHPTSVLKLGASGAAWTVLVIVTGQSVWLYVTALREVGVHTSPFLVRKIGN